VRTTVRLTGIVLRQQGTHDSLCAYYSAAMLLCALRPEFEEQFDAPEVGLDPLYANLPRRRGRTLERSVTDWLTSGVQLPALCASLNAACAAGPFRTRFRYRKVARTRSTAAFLRAQVDLGLPCMLGWESREMGNHTSLVIGYERFARSRSQWLRLLDPIRAQEAMEWGQLARLATAPIEVVWCESHDGVRPDKLTVTRRPTTAGRAHLERWEPRAAKWHALTAPRL
jgi:hypothetical protein